MIVAFTRRFSSAAAVDVLGGSFWVAHMGYGRLATTDRIMDTSRTMGNGSIFDWLSTMGHARS